MKVKDRYLAILSHVETLAIQNGRNPKDITVVCVSKSHPWNEVEKIEAAGCENFGESRVQEALEKIDLAPSGLKWHLIGTLQKNKVNKVIDKFSLIHSVDQLDLASKISEASLLNNTKTAILLQVNISLEASKQGASKEEWLKNFEQVMQLKGVDVKGLMTMAPLTRDQKVLRKIFAELRLFRDQLEHILGKKGALPQLSMGMSNDYPQAIAEGATLLRIGSAIFR